MARRGRAQPQAPIFLRGALVGFVAASTFAPQIHVIQADAHRPPPGHVYFVRAPLAPLPTDQIHVVSLTAWRVYQHPAREADVVFVRPSVSSVVPDRITPQSHVISLVDVRIPSRGRHASVTAIRNALVPPGLASGNAPQIHVQGVNRRVRISPTTHVTALRNALVPPALASGNAVQIHVISPNWRTSHPARDADVILVRPSVASLVPDRICPQIHVVSLRPRRPRPTTQASYRRNPAVTVSDRLPPQIHVLLWHPRRPLPPAHVTQERNPMVPPLVDYIQRHHKTVAITTANTGVVATPTHSVTVDLGTFTGDSITRTYTMALDDPAQTISTSRLDCSESPGMG